MSDPNSTDSTADSEFASNRSDANSSSSSNINSNLSSNLSSNVPSDLASDTLKSSGKTDRTPCVAVDAMGGDNGPGEVVRGVVEAARTSKMQYALVGDPKILETELARIPSLPANISLISATQVIEMTDQPTVAYKKKPDASIVVAARLVKQKKADALVSIGNTGAAMAVSLLTLGRIKGIDRPAIATNLPCASRHGTVVLLDAGATVDCDPNNLYEFALMGAVYAEAVLGIPNPTVGLLSNGEEDSKGNELVKRTRALFNQAAQAESGQRPFNFYGNVEGRDVFRGTTDVVVCDGFVGNVFLKASEGVAEMIMGLLKQELSGSWWTKSFALPLKPSLRRVRGRIDYSERGGAPLLGINGICIIGHGRSNAYAVTNACRAAERAIQHNIIDAIRQRVCDMPSPPPV